MKDGRYCRKCLAPGVQEIITSSRKKYYSCGKCGSRSARFILVDKQGKQKWTSRGLLHFGAGAFIWRGGKILLLQRPVYPFAYTIPGGHMDKGETPRQTLSREIKEETGLDLKNIALIYKGELPGDRCRKGGDIHMWWLYRAEAVGRVRPDKESRSSRWVLPTELKKFHLIFCARALFRKFRLL